MPTRKRKRARSGSTGRSLSVAGYKSVGDEISMPLRKLTLISGINSSGKSSFMQPFLLLKQTIEAEFDAGPILVHGPNVQLTDWAQTLSRGKGAHTTTSQLRIGINLEDRGITNTYNWAADKGLDLIASEYLYNGKNLTLRKNSSEDVVINFMAAFEEGFLDFWEANYAHGRSSRRMHARGDGATVGPTASVRMGKCFLEPFIQLRTSSGGTFARLAGGDATGRFQRFLRSIIHVPGLRGNPERTYNSSSVSSNFPGTVEQYVASVVSRWQSGSDVEKKKLKALSSDLERLGLTWKVLARRINDASVELRVGRMPHAQQGGAQDLVNIVDVGFGVSQTLPVLVALHAALPGQTVYIEHPELHLHPRAQAVLGRLLVEAANRGVYVVAETHSPLILRAAQTAVVNDSISNSDVSLNWFTRHARTGSTQLETAELDQYGRFGEWPVDFDEVSEQVEWDYVESVQRAAHDR